MIERPVDAVSNCSRTPKSCVEKVNDTDSDHAVHTGLPTTAEDIDLDMNSKPRLRIESMIHPRCCL
jgi:hypothetical protein